ncbi:hypothetical protein LEMLEM_LOCUS2527 [Lemmus lemmus]
MCCLLGPTRLLFLLLSGLPVDLYAMAYHILSGTVQEDWLVRGSGRHPWHKAQSQFLLPSCKRKTMSFLQSRDKVNSSSPKWFVSARLS